MVESCQEKWRWNSKKIRFRAVLKIFERVGTQRNLVCKYKIVNC